MWDGWDGVGYLPGPILRAPDSANDSANNNDIDNVFCNRLKVGGELLLSHLLLDFPNHLKHH